MTPGASPPATRRGAPPRGFLNPLRPRPPRLYWSRGAPSSFAIGCGGARGREGESGGSLERLGHSSAGRTTCSQARAWPCPPLADPRPFPGAGPGAAAGPGPGPEPGSGSWGRGPGPEPGSKAGLWGLLGELGSWGLGLRAGTWVWGRRPGPARLSRGPLGEELGPEPSSRFPRSGAAPAPCALLEEGLYLFYVLSLCRAYCPRSYLLPGALASGAGCPASAVSHHVPQNGFCVFAL